MTSVWRAVAAVVATCIGLQFAAAALPVVLPYLGALCVMAIVLRLVWFYTNRW